MMSAKSHFPAAFYWKKRLQRNSAGGIIRVRGVIHGSHRRRKEDQEVSEKSGMSATAISAIERNVSSPTVTTLVAIGRALGESLSSLLGEAEIEYVVTPAANLERLATDIPNVD